MSVVLRQSFAQKRALVCSWPVLGPTFLALFGLWSQGPRFWAAGFGVSGGSRLAPASNGAFALRRRRADSSTDAGMTPVSEGLATEHERDSEDYLSARQAFVITQGQHVRRGRGDARRVDVSRTLLVR